MARQDLLQESHRRPCRGLRKGEFGHLCKLARHHGRFKPCSSDGVDGSTPTASRCAMLVLSQTNRGKESPTWRLEHWGSIWPSPSFNVTALTPMGVVLQKKLRRGAVLAFLGKLDPCLIGMEACATSHHWAREIAALGHDVRLIPPAYVKPYVKRQKNDAADAEAICEAVTRPNMRFVPVKNEEQQRER